MFARLLITVHIKQAWPIAPLPNSNSFFNLSKKNITATKRHAIIHKQETGSYYQLYYMAH